VKQNRAVGVIVVIQTWVPSRPSTLLKVSVSVNDLFPNVKKYLN